jgi:pyruvate,water dikinase
MAAPFSVKWLDTVRLADRPAVGGKGASLGELTHAGIRVPPGFVVPVAAFEKFLASIDPEGLIRTAITTLEGQELAAQSATAAAVRERLRCADFPADVAEDIARAYRTLARNDAEVPVAVRSSATSEDGADASFAGLQDTYLWIRGETAVVEHVRKCWASLYNTESVTYRHRLKLPEEQVAMAVVVQCMAVARTAGVMFTRSPTTGDRSTIVIEGTWGLGSCLVGGEVTPDRYVVSKVTGEIGARTVSRKLVRHVPDLARGGTRVEAIPDELQSKPCLSDDEIAELAAIAKRVERHYGSAQDIEWAIAHEGGASVLYLLQSRPETVWSARKVEPVARPKATPFDHVLAALGQRRT